MTGWVDSHGGKFQRQTLQRLGKKNDCFRYNEKRVILGKYSTIIHNYHSMGELVSTYLLGESVLQ